MSVKGEGGTPDACILLFADNFIRKGGGDPLTDKIRNVVSDVAPYQHYHHHTIIQCSDDKHNYKDKYKDKKLFLPTLCLNHNEVTVTKTKYLKDPTHSTFGCLEFNCAILNSKSSYDDHHKTVPIFARSYPLKSSSLIHF